MVEIRTNTIVETTELHRMEVTGRELIAVLNKWHALEFGSEPIPADAEVTVLVPGGGDWSNTDLDINQHPIEVEWKVKKREIIP